MTIDQAKQLLVLRGLDFVLGYAKWTPEQIEIIKQAHAEGVAANKK